MPIIYFTHKVSGDILSEVFCDNDMKERLRNEGFESEASWKPGGELVFTVTGPNISCLQIEIYRRATYTNIQAYGETYASGMGTPETGFGHHTHSLRDYDGVLEIICQEIQRDMPNSLMVKFIRPNFAQSWCRRKIGRRV